MTQPGFFDLSRCYDSLDAKPDPLALSLIFKSYLLGACSESSIAPPISDDDGQ